MIFRYTMFFRIKVNFRSSGISVMLACFIFFFSGTMLSAEIVYLRDGKVLNGVITREGKDGIFLKSGDSEKEILQKDILRILYGNQEMEEVYVLFKDGRITKGFLVDQDEEKIVLRSERYSPDERTIQRRDIREVSKDNIFPADLEIFLKPMYYLPVDSGGADLEPSLSFLAGMGFNSMITSNLRIVLETGYIKSESSTNDKQSFQVIPVTFSFEYRIGSPDFFAAPRIGAGVGIMEFDTGEGEVKKSNALDLVAGAGLYFRMFSRVYVGLFCDYMYLYDGSDSLQNVLAGISCAYRL